MFSRSIYVVALVLYHFLWPNNILLCGHTIHLSVDGHLGCFHFLAVTIMLLRKHSYTVFFFTDICFQFTQRHFFHDISGFASILWKYFFWKQTFMPERHDCTPPNCHLLKWSFCGVSFDFYPILVWLDSQRWTAILHASGKPTPSSSIEDLMPSIRMLVLPLWPQVSFRSFGAPQSFPRPSRWHCSLSPATSCACPGQASALIIFAIPC